MGLIQSVGTAGSFTLVGDIPVHAVAQIDGTGAIVSGAISTTGIPAGTTSDTVVKASPGRLARVIITAPGSGNSIVSIYDNASAPSGLMIAALPQNAAAGSIFLFDVPAVNGITIAGSAGSPGLTVSYS